MADQVIVIYAGARGYLDKVPVAEVQAVEAKLLEFIATEHADMRDLLIDQAALTEEVESKLKSALEAFRTRLAS